MAADHITLTVPARSEFAKTVRMTAAELASRIGMTYDDVDEVRMAAEEAFVLACARCAGADTVTFDFELGTDSLTVTAGPLVDDAGVAAGKGPEGPYAGIVLESVCDLVEVGEAGPGGRALTIVKRAVPPEV